MNKTGPFVKTLDGARQFKRILGNSKKKRGLASGFVILKKRAAVGLHNTGKREEVLVILQGTAQVSIADKRFILKKGTVLYIPPDTLHNVENSHARLLKYLYVTAGI
ncbi:MAG: cupin domain-containing protein [Candidatus Omnitrophica bacterium]|jgi:mannose-6-phosphate isomerase-like protein (cupin superfamily)|nr:cupin domain-containing protein [Candidatus Omnitrophota bacterium]